jgi:galactokinase
VAAAVATTRGSAARVPVPRVPYRGRVRPGAVASATAPGRVTLLGEHTDYNEGRSLAVATLQRTSVVVAPGASGTVRVDSAACGTATCRLAAPEGPGFVVLAAALATAAGVDGARLDVTSDLPLGAGLSSSAAYAVAAALALGVDGDDLAVARACQDAERRAGADVGLLDQLAVLAARADEVVALDFATLATARFALHPAIALTVVDSGVRRRVGETAYAARRAQCAAAARVLGPLGRAGVHDPDALSDPVLRRRARHVVTECARVDAAVTPLREGGLAAFGALLDEGHASLRDDFDVSNDAVEQARDALRAQGGVAGVRLTGAGFGGALLVAHDPEAHLDADGRWSSPVRPGPGAARD